MRCGACGSERLLGPMPCQQGSPIQVEGVQPERRGEGFKTGRGRYLVAHPQEARICLDCGLYMRFFDADDLAMLNRLPPGAVGGP